MPDDLQRLSQDFAKLFVDPNEFVGRCSGSPSNDGTINVVRPDGGSVNARLANTGRGNKALCQKIGGKWYAWRENESNIEQDRIISERRSYPTEKPKRTGNIKVLFAKQNGNQWDLYIGGDRPNPVKIHSLPSLPTEAHLSNTGKKLNDWVVGLKTTSSTIVNIFGTEETPFICNESFVNNLAWQGAGVWTYHMEPSNIIYTQTYYNIVTDGNTEGATTLLLDETGVYSTTNPFLTATGIYSYHFVINSETNVVITEDYENKTFVFYKELASYSGSKKRNFNRDSTESTSSGVATTIETDYRQTKIPRYLSEDNIINSTETYNYKNNFQTSSSGSVTLLFESIQNNTDISLVMSGLKTQSYRNKQINITGYDRNSNPVTTTISDTVSVELSSSGVEPPVEVSKLSYETPLDSIKPILGATLKGKSYYLVAPSTLINPGKALYTAGIWSGKTTGDYVTLPNVYDNSTPTTELDKVPVWRVRFNETSFKVLDDEESFVFPLLANPTVMEASYYPG